MSTKQPLNVLVLGYGFSAKVFHIPFISHTPGLKLHSILQRTSSPGGSAREDYRNTDVVVFESWEEVEGFQKDALDVADKGRIDVLVVTAGNQVHAEFARKGLLLAGEGVHVVVEKPFTVGVKEAEEVAALARKMGRVVTVYHNRRFDSDFLTLCKLLSSSPQPRLTQITHLRSSYNRYVPATPHRKPWKRETILGNGVLYDLGSHLIDQVLHLFRTGLLFTTTTTESTQHNGLPTRLLATLRDERGMYLPQSRDRDQWGQTWVDDGFDILFEYHPPTTSSSSNPSHQVITVHLTATSTSPLSPQERFLARGTAQTGYVKFGLDTQEAQLLSLLEKVPITEINPTNPGTIPAQETDPHAGLGFGEEPENEWGQLTTLSVAQDGKNSKWTVEKVTPEKGDYMKYYLNLEAALTKRAAAGDGGDGKEVVDVEVKPEHAVDVLRVIEAAGRSWREGRWVEVV